jgi:hypothetical protein
MTVDISYFSIASILALIVFIAIMIPRSLFHAGHVVFTSFSSKKAPADRWLVAIAVSFLVCLGLSLATGLFNARAHTLLDDYESVTLSFLFFAAPAVLQVLRAWMNSRTKKARVLSHLLVALAILSLPASMAVPTAALLQSTADAAPQPAAAGAITPVTSLMDERYFTDSEIANDPDDYPIAAFLNANFSWSHTFSPGRRMMGQNFYREIPTFTAFWFDQTANALSFEATDTFGVLVSPITHVRANVGFSLAVFLYKLLCGLVLVAVSFDAVIGPLAGYVGRIRRKRSARVGGAGVPGAHFES